MIMMTKKELKYMEEYMLKETGTIPHNEYKYDEEEQTVFESILSDAIDLFRKENASKKAITSLSKYLSEENDKVKEYIESPVSRCTLINRYHEQGLTAYLKVLDDDDLELAYHIIRREEINTDTDKMLGLIEMEKAYRHYSDILEGLKEGKTK